MELQTLNNLGYDEEWLRNMVEDPEFRKKPENRYWEVPFDDRWW